MATTNFPGHANADREALEARAIQGYRSGELTHYQASRLLGMSRFEFESFLKDRKVYDHSYGLEDFEQHLRTLRRVGQVFQPSRRFVIGAMRGLQTRVQDAVLPHMASTEPPLK